MLIDDASHTSLSDGYDPNRPAREVPGGIVESVKVSYQEPSDLAVRISEAEDWLRSSGETRTIESLILSTQRHIEQEYGLALVPQTVTAVISGPSREAELPRMPFGSLTSVEEVENGERQGDLSSGYYVLSGVLNAKNGPAIKGSPIEVKYDAGYDQTPKDIQTAIKRILTDLFDRRGDISEEAVGEIPRNAKSLLRNYTN